MLFRRCVRAAPTSAPARLNLASALTEQGRLSAAVRHRCLNRPTP
jgi:hypothetical protein